MEKDARNLYFDLLKRTLSFTLWDEPGMSIEMFAYRKGSIYRKAILMFAKLLRLFRYQVVKLPTRNSSDKEEGKIWPRYAESMIGLKRLENIQHCIETAIKNNVKGDFIETGVWR